MNTILLQPTDVLFFRDGRPMSGSLAGHTAAWPLPDLTNHALHAALHRAGLEGVHEHRRGRSGCYSRERDRKFGSLVTAGPFPVDASDRWFFPRPKDAQANGSAEATLRPARGVGMRGGDGLWEGSSLPKPLRYAVANTRPPEKDAGGEPWISADAFNAYRDAKPFESRGTDAVHFLLDSSIADQEANPGIKIDPETQTTGQGTAEGGIYTAHYLRLREGFRLGLFAKAPDKAKGDLVSLLFGDHPLRIVVGGQQRICTAEFKQRQPVPLPRGLSARDEFAGLPSGKYAVKWVLLAPAVWPEIVAEEARHIRAHPGGWLPNWICPDTGAVLLKTGDTARGDPEGREAWRARVRTMTTIQARLVAAIVPKPIVVTGWALPNETDRTEGGAKSTHLAVPAGAVYYFEADSEDAARQLAAALNWHGADQEPATIRNRRSTLLGEKGYGLGACGTWDFHTARQP